MSFRQCWITRWNAVRGGQSTTKGDRQHIHHKWHRTGHTEINGVHKFNKRPRFELRFNDRPSVNQYNRYHPAGSAAEGDAAGASNRRREVHLEDFVCRSHLYGGWRVSPSAGDVAQGSCPNSDWRSGPPNSMDV